MGVKNIPTIQKIETSRENGDLPDVYIDDKLMSLKYYIDEHVAHLHLVNPQVCAHCDSKACLFFCPVGAYRESAGGEVQIAYQSCIECGSCRVMCPHNNIEWKYPRGGYGIAYKFG